MNILIVCPPKNEVFKPIANACYASFKILGHNVKQATEYENGYDLALFIVFHHSWTIPKDSNTIKVGYHFEQLPWGGQHPSLRVWFRKFQQQERLYDYVVDYSLNNTQWLRQQGYNKIFWCALGYHSIFEKVKQNIDPLYPVRFLGFTKQKRRKRIIKGINDKLLSRQIQIDPWTQGFDAVPQAQIQLNLHNYDQDSFEPHRVIRLMSSKQFVLTEPVSEIHPFTNKVHWVESKWSDMSSYILYYLDHPEERIQIAEQGYEFIKKHYNFTIHLQRFLNEIETCLKKRKV